MDMYVWLVSVSKLVVSLERELGGVGNHVASVIVRELSGHDGRNRNGVGKLISFTRPLQSLLWVMEFSFFFSLFFSFPDCMFSCVSERLRKSWRLWWVGTQASEDCLLRTWLPLGLGVCVTGIYVLACILSLGAEPTEEYASFPEAIQGEKYTCTYVS